MSQNSTHTHILRRRREQNAIRKGTEMNLKNPKGKREITKDSLAFAKSN